MSIEKMKRSKSDANEIILRKELKQPRLYRSVSGNGAYSRPKNYSRSRSWVLTSRRDVNKKRLLRRMSESFIPNCVLVPNRSPVDDLYKLFPQLPPGEKPLNDFSCALYKDILLQGKMIICSSCICFHSNIFGYETRVIIYFKNVLAIKREKTAFVVPNAISIQTLHKRYLFCSFLSRESSFKLLSRVWKHFVNEDDEIDKLTPPIKIAGARKEISEDMLNFSSSSSYGSTIRRCLPERPHSSPPSIGGGFLGGEEIVSPAQTPQDDDDDCVFTVGNESSDGSSSSLTLDRITVMNTTSLGLRKVKSTSNISEAAALGYRFCFKNLQDIRNEKLKKGLLEHRESSGLCLLSTKLKKVKDVAGQRLSIFSSHIKSFKSNHPFVLAMSILVILLAIFSFNLLLRINGITDSLQTHHNHNTLKDNVRLKDLFEFKEGMHSANVERVRSILSINLETVSEVQKALRELREKLNGQK